MKAALKLLKQSQRPLIEHLILLDDIYWRTCSKSNEFALGLGCSSHFVF